MEESCTVGTKGRSSRTTGSFCHYDARGKVSPHWFIIRRSQSSPNDPFREGTLMPDTIGCCGEEQRGPSKEMSATGLRHGSASRRGCHFPGWSETVYFCSGALPDRYLTPIRPPINRARRNRIPRGGRPCRLDLSHTPRTHPPGGTGHLPICGALALEPALPSADEGPNPEIADTLPG